MKPGRPQRSLGEMVALVRAARAGVQLAAGWKIAVGAAIVTVPLLLVAGAFAAGSGAAGGGGVEQSCRVVEGPKGGIEVPENYVSWLEKAAAKYKLGPKGFSIVAAIHYVESDFARTLLPGVKRGTQNEAGAEGPGQFLVPSWEEYGQDGNGDGVKDVYSIPDSVFGTAYYMEQFGAPKNWHDAIFAYNHAEWYVEKVLKTAEEIGGSVVCSEELVRPVGVVEGDLQGMEEAARWIESKKIHYCWGGGHGEKPGPSPGIAVGEFCPTGAEGLDCSGSVRWLLVLSGYKDKGGMVSGQFGKAYPAGPGKAVTIWSSASHVWIEINGKDWGTASSNLYNGPGYGPQTTTGFVQSHPEGL